MADKIVNMNIAELVVTQEPVVICTVLGSCVSVCLFTQDGSGGGMIHFALPKEMMGDEENPLRYGDTAIETLVRELCRLTAKSPKLFKAKIIGGANNVQSGGSAPKIGDENVAIARKLLSKFEIPVVGEDVGGSVGRKVLFHTRTGRLQSAFVGQGFSRPSAEKAVRQTWKPGPSEVKKTAVSVKKKVLIVDDSKTIREILYRIIQRDPNLEVVGQAEDPIRAESLLHKLKPDVITLDVHMPTMTGVQWLKTLLPQYPIPVVMITSLGLQDGNEVFQALDLGAVDYIQKPAFNEIDRVAPLICEKIRNAAGAKVRVEKSKRPTPIIMPNVTYKRDLVVAIGASTGGTEALKEVLTNLPANIPPIVIVQHIPPVFSEAFAKRMNELCPFDVKEAADGDAIHANRVLIAPGGLQMKVVRKSSGLFVEVNDDPPMTRHKPSVDYLFHSVADILGEKAIGIILTGMGADGAKGLLKMREIGSITLSQDEASCVVYGMPKSAWEIGASSRQVELEKVAEAIVELSRKR